LELCISILHFGVILNKLFLLFSRLPLEPFCWLMLLFFFFLSASRIGPVSWLRSRFRPGSATASALASASGPALVVLAHFPVDRISQR